METVDDSDTTARASAAVGGTGQRLLGRHEPESLRGIGHPSRDCQGHETFKFVVRVTLLQLLSWYEYRRAALRHALPEHEVAVRPRHPTRSLSPKAPRAIAGNRTSVARPGRPQGPIGAKPTTCADGSITAVSIARKHRNSHFFEESSHSARWHPERTTWRRCNKCTCITPTQGYPRIKKGMYETRHGESAGQHRRLEPMSRMWPLTRGQPHAAPSFVAAWITRGETVRFRFRGMS
jgi:hypothetical protein